MESLLFLAISLLALVDLRNAKPVKDSGCKDALGIQTGFLEDRDIKMSSSQKGFSAFDAWCPTTNNDKQFFAVDLGENFHLTKIATQGKVDDKNRFIKSFILEYSDDNKKWNVHKTKGGKDAYEGNKDMFSVRDHIFEQPLVGRYIKLIPKSWNNAICNRMELFGCAVDDMDKDHKDKSEKKVVDQKPAKVEEQPQKLEQNQTALVPDTVTQKLIEEEKHQPASEIQALLVPDGQPKKLEEPAKSSEQPVDLDKDFREALKNL